MEVVSSANRLFYPAEKKPHYLTRWCLSSPRAGLDTLVMSLPEIEPRLLYHAVGILAANCLMYSVSAFKWSTEEFTAAYAHRKEFNRPNWHTTWTDGSFTVMPCRLKHNNNNNNNNNNKHQWLDPLIRSVSRVTAARANASSVFQLFSFLVVCSGMISKGFAFCGIIFKCESQFRLYSSILSSMAAIRSSRRMYE